ncbi:MULTISPECIES: hypothetical protein [Acidilobus]|jgi:hypothetical protein|uniref:Uncharacterized protein n=1 Tax=Acidilobus saccharovorans (strain DSM 16705 / JCM 18335 / VKM B-2471 / 345-15) TaxID=666510 RepID=D9Q2L4_ACIS3|nr:hypothetical protein [Acidilobus saccharovorans]ADL19552.1 hypothetical protein ASAC_1147 [Acidilobus saccharovorans 345-15]
MSGEERAEIVRHVQAEAKVGKALKNIAMISLKPDDLASPASFQMAISRLYESIMKMMESGGPEQTYIAEVRFTDDLGNPVSIAIDLGKETPPFSSQKVKAEITIRLYEEE